MKKSYSKQEKERIIKQHESGISITSIHNSTGIARSTLHNCINEYNSKKDNFSQVISPVKFWTLNKKLSNKLSRF